MIFSTNFVAQNILKYFITPLQIKIGCTDKSNICLTCAQCNLLFLQKIPCMKQNKAEGRG